MSIIKYISYNETDKENLIVIKLGYAACGLFSYIFRALHSINYFYPNKVYMDWTEKFGYQVLGENVWDVLFYQPDIDNINSIDDRYNIIITYGMEDKNGNILSKDDFISDGNGNIHFYLTDFVRIRGKQLIDEKIRLRPYIKEKINKFFNENIKDKKCLAVHRRGCIYQHVNEKITDLKFNEKLLNIIKNNSYELVFLCSDNYESKNNLINFLNQNQIKVVFYNSHLSKDSCGYGHISIHTSHKSDVYQVNGNILAEEVLIESYLMSMCEGLYCTVSGVSNYSLLLNPDLKVYYVDKQLVYKKY